MESDTGSLSPYVMTLCRLQRLFNMEWYGELEMITAGEVT